MREQVGFVFMARAPERMGAFPVYHPISIASRAHTAYRVVHLGGKARRQRLRRWIDLIHRFLQGMIWHPLWVLAGIGLVTAGLGWAALSLEFSTDLREMLPDEDFTVREFVDSSRNYGSQDFLLVAVHAQDTVFNAQTLKKIWEMSEAFQTLSSQWVEEVRNFFNSEVIEGSDNALAVRVGAATLPQTPEEIEAFRRVVMGERLLSRIFVSQDERTALVILEEDPRIINSDQSMAMTEAVERLVAPYQGPESIRLSGGPYIMAYVRKAMIRDLRVLIPFAVGLLLVVLFLSFRQLRGMLLPVTVTLLSVVWTLGVMALMGFQLTIVSVVIPVILIAIVNADSIHILTRYQEALHDEPDKRQALLIALKTISKPVIYTSLTSAVGFLGLATAYSVIIQQFGLATAIGILFGMVLSLTALPALLILLPARSAPHLAQPPGLGAGWHLRRRPLQLMLAAAVVVFGVSLVGVSRIEINNNPLDYVRADLPMVQSARFIENTFGGSLTLRVSLNPGKPDRWKDPQWLKQVEAFQTYVEALRYTGPTLSIVDVVKEINQSLHGDDPSYETIPDTTQAVAQSLLLFEFSGGTSLGGLVKSDYSAGQVTITIRSLPLKLLTPLIQSIRDYLDAHFADVPYEITGQPMFGLRLGQTLVTSQLSSLLLTLALVWGMMWALARSLRLSLISIVPLAFSVAVMFGVMGFSGIALDIGTVMVASVAIGIGVDFAVHFIAQYRQARQQHPPEVSIERALKITWRPLVYNALSVGLGFSVMLFSQFTANIAFGALMGLTLVVALVATLGLLPALLLLTTKAKRHGLEKNGRVSQ